MFVCLCIIFQTHYSHSRAHRSRFYLLFEVVCFSCDKSSTIPLIQFDDDDTGACVAYALYTRSHRFDALYWLIVHFIDPDGATNYTFSI